MSYTGLRKQLLVAIAGTALFFAVAQHAHGAPLRHHKRHAAQFVPGVIGGRPQGCPFRFCGCEASLYLFNRIIPELNLAANWIRKFPRAHPAPGMAAARPGHVFVLIRQISGNEWLVHDGNFGGHKTREHVRSIAGYVIVDPHSMAGL